MGRDKSLLAIDGVPMAVRVAEVLRAAGCTSVVAIGGDSVALAAAGLVVIADEYPGEGPLGGVITALAAHPDAAAVVVVACDLPAVRPASVCALLDGVKGHDVAVATADRVQPVCAAWRPGVAATLRAMFEGGERRMLAALAALSQVAVAVAPHDLTNVNTLGDLPE
jgi:molybdenum cofactor guanylyltransferase